MLDKGIQTRERILELAQSMVQERGYNAVSFRDLSAAVNIKAASIHYYFPSKEDLVDALVDRYRAQFSAGRTSLDQPSLTPVRKLRRYIEMVRTAFQKTGRMCLCGILAAEMCTLPERVAKSVRGFFTENEEWLAKVLAAGRSAGQFHFEGSATHAAEGLFAALEGALMSAWTFKDEDRIVRVASLIVESLVVSD